MIDLNDTIDDISDKMPFRFGETDSYKNYWELNDSYVTDCINGDECATFHYDFMQGHDSSFSLTFYLAMDGSKVWIAKDERKENEWYDENKEICARMCLSQSWRLKSWEEQAADLNSMFKRMLRLYSTDLTT